MPPRLEAPRSARVGARMTWPVSPASLGMSRRGQARRRFLIQSSRLLFGAAGLAASLGRTRAVGAASQVTIGVMETPCVAPAHVAVSQGFLRDEGIDASIVD